MTTIDEDLYDDVHPGRQRLALALALAIAITIPGLATGVIHPDLPYPVEA